MIEISAKLEEALNRALIKVFPKENRSPKTSLILTSTNIVPASKPEFGDFQINCALALAKEIKQPPRQIAEQISNQLKKDNDYRKRLAGNIKEEYSYANAFTQNQKNIVYEELLWLASNYTKMASDYHKKKLLRLINT